MGQLLAKLIRLLPLGVKTESPIYMGALKGIPSVGLLLQSWTWWAIGSAGGIQNDPVSGYPHSQIPNGRSARVIKISGPILPMFGRCGAPRYADGRENCSRPPDSRTPTTRWILTAVSSAMGARPSRFSAATLGEIATWMYEARKPSSSPSGAFDSNAHPTPDSPNTYHDLENDWHGGRLGMV